MKIHRGNPLFTWLILAAPMRDLATMIARANSGAAVNGRRGKAVMPPSQRLRAFLANPSLVMGGDRTSRREGKAF